MSYEISGDELALYVNTFVKIDPQNNAYFTIQYIDSSKLYFVTRIVSVYPSIFLYFVDENLTPESCIKFPHLFFKQRVKIII